MHQSFVTTAPPPTGMGRGGDSEANVQGSDLSSSPAVPGLCYYAYIPNGIYYD